MKIFISHLFIFLLLCCTLPVKSQGITNNWIMGYGPNMNQRSLFDFSGGVASINQYAYPMQYRYANTTISDSIGNLLFSVNGYYIADASGDTMLNGSGINPSFYTTFYPDGLSIPQANFAILKPGSSTEYLLFHSTIDNASTLESEYLYLSRIDISANGGLGGVIQKNQVLISDLLNIGKITGCKHANGRDWWVFCHKSGSNQFYRLLVTPYGIYGPYSQSIGVIRPNDGGQVSFSPDGTKFAYYWPIEDLEIFDFDRCSGLLSNPVHITFNDSAANGGVAFSPNSSVLYVASTKYVYQFDVSSVNIPATQTIVAVWDSFYSPSPPLATLFVLEQLAPDGKIYITTGNGGYHLHVINQPDSLGSVCDLVQHGVQIPNLYFNTLPNHPNYFLGSDSGSVCDSLNWVGINESAEINISAYPNPASENISFTYPPMKQSGEMEIFNTSGILLKKDYIPAWSQFRKIDISNFADGIYFVKIRWGNKLAGVKIIKRQ